MPRARIISQHDGAQLPALDLRTLGRPFHLLPVFGKALQEELADFLQQELNRRYHARFHIRALEQAQPAADERRWLWHALDGCQLGSHIERPLLLRLLDYRFGAPTAQPDADAAAPAETETERRLARSLAERLLPRLLQCVLRLDRQAGGLPPGPADCALLPFVPPGTGVWEIRLDIGDGEHAVGALRLQLDAACFERLLKNLSGRRDSADAQAAPADTFRDRLRVRLQARLLDREMALGDIMDLRPGSVLPVTLQARSEVLVGASRLFDAEVAEQHGKLCLTGFVASE
ncbi:MULTISPECIES: FliM/FliN family flagellar motor C-terminal domain-containing protein [unclassified Chromobacterium]|uniref:FliM/FliN family flagellar motor C-terminal domain-containing protein n=1 Tax=unclassified Chromobacterium TaxID=2641838 RepID=UPI000D31DF5A|nr:MULTISPECIES: flagellar motor switch protein FliM [unclassified Chromobacterium]MCP1293081.1 FliM/FliN family flagellar motor switch protein [Chromobacterium sp. S0633]PTU64488.1 flagellar motor switch protein FliM [Chromobacterium sp. Panama]UJB29877.1 flagellar motor switch protein FliM [Chromobacterium sp. Beijing]